MSFLVPLFPLPNVVLLPRAVLPLHVFEERYKVMTRDALTSDGQVAIAMLLRGWEKNYYGSPPIESVICVGKIIQHEELADGKYNFLLQGVSRARVIREERVNLYRVAETEPLEESGELDIDLTELREKMVRVFAGALGGHPLAPTLLQLLRSIFSTSDAADVIAFHLLTDPKEKQLMLEEPDARRRISRLLEQLEEMGRALKQAALTSHPQLN